MGREILPRIAAKWSYRSFLRNHQIPERKIVKTIIDNDPERRAKVIADGKARMAELAAQNPGILLDRQSLQADLTFLQPGIFANVKKAVLPAHEIRHMATTRLFAELGANIVGAQQVNIPEQQRVAINRDALLKSAIVHDVPRYIYDFIASLPRFNRLHGKVAAIKFPKWFPELDSQTIQIAQEALRYHDYHQTPNKINNPTLELLVIADRLELSRLVFGRVYGRRMLKWIFEHRARAYKTKYFPNLREELMPVAQAFYLKSIDEINKRVGEAQKQGRKMQPSEQIDAVFAAAQELGMLKPETREPTSVVTESDPNAVVVRTRRSGSSV